MFERESDEPDSPDAKSMQRAGVIAVAVCKADHDHNLTMLILVLHGWQPVPGGVKPTYLKDHGYTVVNPKLSDEDVAEAVRIAQQEFDEHKPDVVAGSSRGGAAAMNIESRDARLVLLRPAWKKWGIADMVKPGTMILHSKSDEVVPFANSEELVRNSGLPGVALISASRLRRIGSVWADGRASFRIVPAFVEEEWGVTLEDH